CVATLVLLGLVSRPSARTKSVTVPRSPQPFQHWLWNSRTVASVVPNTLFECVGDLLLQRLYFPCRRTEYCLGTFAHARFIPGDCRHGPSPVLSVVGLVEGVFRLWKLVVVVVAFIKGRGQLLFCCSPCSRPNFSKRIVLDVHPSQRCKPDITHFLNVGR